MSRVTSQQYSVIVLKFAFCRQFFFRSGLEFTIIHWLYKKNWITVNLRCLCCKIVGTYSKNQTNKQTETKPTLIRSGTMCTQEKELFSLLVHIDIVRSLHLNILQDIETNRRSTTWCIFWWTVFCAVQNKTPKFGKKLTQTSFYLSVHLQLYSTLSVFLRDRIIKVFGNKCCHAFSAL